MILMITDLSFLIYGPIKLAHHLSSTIQCLETHLFQPSDKRKIPLTGSLDAILLSNSPVRILQHRRVAEVSITYHSKQLVLQRNVDYIMFLAPWLGKLEIFVFG